ncbi:MAG: NUDIX domain-containing protein [Desulfobacteraceae bacterium]|nr:NUDIX domain-containing protein [Desulfobacteraceae bacterium]
MIIPIEQYERIIDVLPILCVDIVVKNSTGEYLLIKRANEPLKGNWWVIGGRVLKGETLKQAAVRKVKEETFLDVDAVFPIGYYEDTVEANPFGLASRLHSVSVVFSASVDDHQQIKLDYQSTDWKYSKVLPANFHIKSFDGNQDIR